VEAAGAEKRRIEHVGTVRRRNQDDALVGLEAIHLDEELVQGLLAFVVAAPKAGAAMAANGVYFIDEDDARRVLLGLLEHVTDAARADADEHFHEIRSGNRKEGHVGFPRDGARKQRLAGPWRADKQKAARDSPRTL